jgi:hypothetical protein
METSLLKTLANKQRASMMQMVRKYRSTIDTPHGPMKCLEMVVEREGKKPLIARFGGIPLRQREKANMIDLPFTIGKPPERNELIKRLLANKCELCESTEDIRVHHIRKLADIQKRGKSEQLPWMKIMSMRRRKTLVVCHKCHKDIHSGQFQKRTRK